MPCITSGGKVDQLWVDHLVFRIRNLSETERFYTALLDRRAQEYPDSIMYKVADTRLFFTTATTSPLQYDKEQIGLNHLAFGVHSEEELRSIAQRLNDFNIRHSGIQVDHYGKKDFIWIDDPDGLRVEFYLRGRED